MEVCGEDLVSPQSVTKWCVEFQSRRVLMEDCERSGSPTTGGIADRSALADSVIHSSVNITVGEVQHALYLSHKTLTRHHHSRLRV